MLEYFVAGNKRVDVPIKTVYTTDEERIQGESINNASKAEILNRAEERVTLSTDEDVTGVLWVKLNELKRKQLSSKKEALLSFFHEVCEELKQNVDPENVEFLEDANDEGDCSD